MFLCIFVMIPFADVGLGFRELMLFVGGKRYCVCCVLMSIFQSKSISMCDEWFSVML